MIPLFQHPARLETLPEPCRGTVGLFHHHIPSVPSAEQVGSSPERCGALHPIRSPWRKPGRFLIYFFIKPSSQSIPKEGLFELGAEPYVWFPAKRGIARGGEEMYFGAACLRAGCSLALKELFVKDPLVVKQMWGPGPGTRYIPGASCQ